MVVQPAWDAQQDALESIGTPGTIGGSVAVSEVLSCLSVAGGLSMGLPVDHGARVAVLADRLAAAADVSNVRGVAVVAALLRWSGCTANAHEFADVLGDDVRGRSTLLAFGPEAFTVRQRSQLLSRSVALTTAHCDVAQRLARRLAVHPHVIDALGAVFEQWDGEGFPSGVSGGRLPVAQRVVAIAGDLEIMLRAVGPAPARRNLLRTAGRRHDPALVELAVELLPDLVAELDDVDVWDLLPTTAVRDGLVARFIPTSAALLVLADFADLKLPWNAGMSRRAAVQAAAIADRLADATTAQSAGAVALVSGLGKVAVPNTIWELPRTLHRSEWEQIRLVPYYTEQCLDRAPELAEQCRAAGLVFERLDGSGYYRGVNGTALDATARVAQTSVAATAMSTRRSWRAPMRSDEVARTLAAEVGAGRLDRRPVEILGQMTDLPITMPRNDGSLTAREVEVLTELARGHTNRSIARRLSISPKTVSRHLENLYRKLDVRSRAAATLAAVERGLLT